MGSTSVQRAVKTITQGGLVVYPTDTLYALGASIFDDDAVREVFSLKHRPFSIPLPVAVSSIDKIKDIAMIDSTLKHQLSTFMPGRITIILPKKPAVTQLVTAQKNTIAVRVPDDETARSLLSKTGPLTVTSANIHGQSTPFSIGEIKKCFSNVGNIMYLDEGKRMGSSSTIVDVTGSSPRILRRGAIPDQDIMAVWS